MLELLHDAHAQKQAFVDACAWAEDIYLCMAWLEPGDAYGPSFSDLEPHQSKLRQVIVGLARLQTYPTLLRRLYRANVLRLVSTLDGSFSPNCYVFRRSTRVRVIVASAPFTATRVARPCESFVVFEGERDDRFALRALELLERCRAQAHVPSATELDAYEVAWADARTDARVPESIPGLVHEPFDGGTLQELTAVCDATELLRALVQVRESLAASAALRTVASFVPRGSDGALGMPCRGTLYWSSLGAWSALVRSGDQYGLHIGFVPPWELERPVAALSLTAARVGLPGQLVSVGASRMAIARAGDGRRFVVHVADRGSHAPDVRLSAGAESIRCALVGEVGSADFVRTASAFALRTSRRRRSKLEEAVQ